MCVGKLVKAKKGLRSICNILTVVNWWAEGVHVGQRGKFFHIFSCLLWCLSLFTVSLYDLLFFFFNVYLFFEKESTCMHVQVGKEQRDGDIRFEAGSALTAESPMQGSNSRTKRSWPEPKSGAQPTEPPRPCHRLILYDLWAKKGFYIFKWWWCNGRV